MSNNRIIEELKAQIAKKQQEYQVQGFVESKLYSECKRLLNSNNGAEITSQFKKPAKKTKKPRQDSVTTALKQIEQEYIAKSIEQIQSGALDINAAHRDGQTLLHYVAMFGDADAAKLLIQNGADVDMELERRDGNKYNALHLAANAGNTEVVRILLIYTNIPIDQPMSNGHTALSLAIMKANEPLADLLFQNGASLDISVAPFGSYRRYPLLEYMLSMPDEREYLASVELLLNLGVPVTDKAFDAVITNQYLAALKLLLEHSTTISQELIELATSIKNHRAEVITSMQKDMHDNKDKMTELALFRARNDIDFQISKLQKSEEIVNLLQAANLRGQLKKTPSVC